MAEIVVSFIEVGRDVYQLSAEVEAEDGAVRLITFQEPVIRSVVDREGWGIPVTLVEFLELYSRAEGLSEDDATLMLLETVFEDYMEEQEWLYSGRDT